MKDIYFQILCNAGAYEKKENDKHSETLSKMLLGREKLSVQSIFENFLLNFISKL
jgi:hypothetical protein